MSEPTIIRPATKQDLERIMDLWQEYMQSYHETLDPDYYPNTEENFDSYARHLFRALEKDKWVKAR